MPFDRTRASRSANLLCRGFKIPNMRDRGNSVVMVTGAGGHIGTQVCRLLKAAGKNLLSLDVSPRSTTDFTVCDLTNSAEIARLFDSHPVHAVVHLAAVLPSAFRRDPLRGAEVNLTASIALLRQAVKSGTKRFVFASSMSVYGSSVTNRPLTEDDPAAPDDPYGASKRAVELVGEALDREKKIEFVALRVARVVGPGVRKTSSPWRAEIFETSAPTTINIPFAPNAVLSLVHVEDVARMLTALLESPQPRSSVYNTPVELWEARQLKEVLEQARGIHVELQPGGPNGGPICDGSRFVSEFGFELRSLRDRLTDVGRAVPPSRS
jgi:nucleoside-diphosphate-sugar epimerase